MSKGEVQVAVLAGTRDHKPEMEDEAYRIIN